MIPSDCCRGRMAVKSVMSLELSENNRPDKFIGV